MRLLRTLPSVDRSSICNKGTAHRLPNPLDRKGWTDDGAQAADALAKATRGADRTPLLADQQKDDEH